ncbi:MAG: iron-sulfur cluster assembly scaffold protein [Candidatus Micrarchaeota archaeon]
MDIYRENVLDHYKNPRNFGNMRKPNARHKDSNPYCGDEVEFFLRIDSKGIITQAKYFGTGCAISQASASMLSEKLRGMQLEEALKLGKEEVEDWIGSRLAPTRLKCALLPLLVVKTAILKFENKKPAEK